MFRARLRLTCMLARVHLNLVRTTGSRHGFDERMARNVAPAHALHGIVGLGTGAERVALPSPAAPRAHTTRRTHPESSIACSHAIPAHSP